MNVNSFSLACVAGSFWELDESKTPTKPPATQARKSLELVFKCHTFSFRFLFKFCFFTAENLTVLTKLT